MKPDLYTKSILTVIALMLTVIAGKTVISPDTTASAQSAPFAGVQYHDMEFFDTRTGDVWMYDRSYGKLSARFKLTKLGQAMTKEVAK